MGLWIKMVRERLGIGVDHAECEDCRSSSQGSCALALDREGNRRERRRKVGAYVHGEDAAWDQLSVLSNGKVPGFYSHEIVEGELQDQSAFCTHLEATNDTLIGCALCDSHVSDSTRSPLPSGWLWILTKWDASGLSTAYEAGTSSRVSGLQRQCSCLPARVC